ncbi:MAG: asparagine synthase (glutamine-hydrolyzing) [Candidatus Hadarchaeum sp.]
MCGIAGILHFDGNPAQAHLVRLMRDVLAHRGPDDSGDYTCGPVGLGHRRLSIIDLSSAGHQPMSNEDETIWITYNGEIYNFLELRRELVLKGHEFRSATDTEVIVHAYEEWGPSCVERFNGMFAFAIWDERWQRMWLVRDRLGVKPLFYSYSPTRFLFGSEIKAILQHPSTDRTIDYEALAYYLALNYIPAPYTLFAQIRQILPGHYLLVDTFGNVQDVAYWDVVYQESEYRDEKEYREQFIALLEDAIRLRLVSDVPFGAFLSGGLDSSTVAYWMSRHMSSAVKTFSIGFPEASYNELDYARQVAQSIQSAHHERIVEADDVAAVFAKIVWHAEEPTADSSLIPVYYLSQMTREHVTMVLSGDGADEILAGYETYQAYYLHRLYRAMPTWLRNHVIIPLVKRLPVSDSKVSWDFKLRRFVKSGDLTSEDAHAIWRMIFDAEQRKCLLAPLHGQVGIDADVTDLYRQVFAQTNARHPLNRMLYVDTRFYLPSDMLVKIDRMSMAHSLEARVPFLDYRLVEFMATVPPNLKLRDFLHKKYLLKAVMQGKLPDAVLTRKKEGFNVPNARWIKGELKPFVTDYLSPPYLRNMGILDVQTTQELLRDHFNGRADNSHQIWCLLTLALWWHQFIEGRSSQ